MRLRLMLVELTLAGLLRIAATATVAVVPESVNALPAGAPAEPRWLGCP